MAAPTPRDHVIEPGLLSQLLLPVNGLIDEQVTDRTRTGALASHVAAGRHYSDSRAGDIVCVMRPCYGALVTSTLSVCSVSPSRSIDLVDASQSSIVVRLTHSHRLLTDKDARTSTTPRHSLSDYLIPSGQTTSDKTPLAPSTKSCIQKLCPKSVLSGVRQQFFSFRVVNLWNSLPEEVVCAPSLNAFKGRRDKY